MSTRRYVVALTGGIGSGKSTVANGFAKHGIDLVDADQIAHQLTGPNGAAMDAIVDVFGVTMRGPDGALERAKMRTHVFAQDHEREKLEAILHPMIRRQTELAIAQSHSPYVMWVVPLLFEGGARARQHAARVLVIDCPEELQISRVMQRSGLRREEVEAIMRRQTPRQTRLELADDVLDNSAGLERLDEPIAQLHANYLALACAAL